MVLVRVLCGLHWLHTNGRLNPYNATKTTDIERQKVGVLEGWMDALVQCSCGNFLVLCRLICCCLLSTVCSLNIVFFP